MIKKTIVLLLFLTMLGATHANLIDLKEQHTDELTNQAPFSLTDNDAPSLIDLCATEATNIAPATTTDTNGALQTTPNGPLPIALAPGGLAVVALIFLALLIQRIRLNQKIDRIHPQSLSEIQEIVHHILRQFGKQAFGRHSSNDSQKYTLLESGCGRQWMIIRSGTELARRHAWLITLNHASTHYEVHHNERRTSSRRTSDLTAKSLEAALAEALAIGPFTPTRAPDESWRNISLR